MVPPILPSCLKVLKTSNSVLWGWDFQCMFYPHVLKIAEQIYRRSCFSMSGLMSSEWITCSLRNAALTFSCWSGVGTGDRGGCSRDGVFKAGWLWWCVFCFTVPSQWHLSLSACICMGNNGVWLFRFPATLGFFQHRKDEVLIWTQGVSFLVSSVLLLSLGKGMFLRMFKNHNEFQWKLKRSCSWTGKDLWGARKEAKARKRSWMRRQVGEGQICVPVQFSLRCRRLQLTEAPQLEEGLGRRRRSRWRRNKCTGRGCRVFLLGGQGCAWVRAAGQS